MTQSLARTINDINISYKQLKDKYDAVFFLCDENTFQYCFIPYFSSFAENKNVFIIPPGEKNKNLENAGKFCAFLLENHADKNSLILNLGGGMVSDLGGFCASIYQRGIDFVNFPTTLLAAADAAIGGKTGINFHQTKNILGTFAQPESILFFPDFLKTLPSLEYLSGWAEIIKTCLLFNPDKWNEVKNLNQLPLNFDFQTKTLIEMCWHQKYKITNEDFYDKGIRQSLNYGHTIGHVIEALSISDKIPILHGFAVAIGMKTENMVAVKKGLMNESTALQINELLDLWFNLHSFHFQFNEDFKQLLMKDKKNTGESVTMSLLTEPGKYALRQSIPLSLIQDVISQINSMHEN